MTLTLYGIPNCDTVRKARRWLDDNSVEYRFHDFRADGLSANKLERWFDALGWEKVINRRSTSWKAISPSQRGAMDRSGALAAAVAAPTLVKRPVLEGAGVLELGFSTDRYAELLSQAQQ